MVNVAHIENFVNGYVATSQAGLQDFKQRRMQRELHQDHRLMQHQVSDVHEINAHSPAGSANTPDAVRPHLDGLPSVANPMSHQSVAMKGYAAAAARLGSAQF